MSERESEEESAGKRWVKRHAVPFSSWISPPARLEECTVSTTEHPHPFEGWDFKARFPGMPIHARRAAMKEAIGKARAYLTALATWQKSGKKKGKPGYPGSADHPTFYQGAFHLKLAEARVRDRFVRLKVYDGQQWVWMNYPARVVELKLDPHLVTVESPPHLAKRQMGIACD